MFSTTNFCLIWVFADYAFYFAQIALLTWAAIERLTLVFHNKWVATRKNRFVHQVIPTLIIVIYSALFILLVIWQKLRLHQPIKWRR
jgi:hypothetical protein